MLAQGVQLNAFEAQWMDMRLRAHPSLSTTTSSPWQHPPLSVAVVAVSVIDAILNRHHRGRRCIVLADVFLIVVMVGVIITHHRRRRHNWNANYLMNFL